MHQRQGVAALGELRDGDVHMHGRTCDSAEEYRVLDRRLQVRSVQTVQCVYGDGGAREQGRRLLYGVCDGIKLGFHLGNGERLHGGNVSALHGRGKGSRGLDQC